MDRMVMKTKDTVYGIDVDVVWEVVRDDGDVEACVHVLPRRDFAQV